MNRDFPDTSSGDTESSSPSTKVLLLSRIRQLDDDEAWRRFVDLYEPLIMRYCRRWGLQEADSLDVMQAVFTNVSRWIDRFEYDRSRGRFRSWLGVITCHEIQRLRTKAARPGRAPGGGRHDALLDSIIRDLDPSWSDENNDRLYRFALERVEDSFDEATWRAFEMTWLHDVPAKQAATCLGKPIGWVYKAKFRVLQRLKQDIERLASDTPGASQRT